MIPSVGSRVSIRHRLPTGEFTDVIGHLLALTPNVVDRFTCVKLPAEAVVLLDCTKYGAPEMTWPRVTMQAYIAVIAPEVLT